MASVWTEGHTTLFVSVQSPRCAPAFYMTSLWCSPSRRKKRWAEGNIPTSRRPSMVLPMAVLGVLAVFGFVLNLRPRVTARRDAAPLLAP